MFHITWGTGLCTRFTTSICPKARPVGVATIKAITTLGRYGPLTQGGITLQAGVWHLSEECVDTLDGYIETLGNVRKAYTRVTIDGVEFPAQIPLVTSVQAAMSLVSSQADLIRRGYQEWGFKLSDLNAVLSLLDRAAA